MYNVLIELNCCHNISLCFEMTWKAVTREKLYFPEMYSFDVWWHYKKVIFITNKFFFLFLKELTLFKVILSYIKTIFKFRDNLRHFVEAANHNALKFLMQACKILRMIQSTYFIRKIILSSLIKCSISWCFKIIYENSNW